MSFLTLPARVVRKLTKKAPLPGSVQFWLPLIDKAARSGKLSSHHLALVRAHELTPSGHAVNAFAESIERQCSDRLAVMAGDPQANIPAVIEEFVRWKTIAQCAHSHDVSKGYFHDAEHHIQWQWDRVIFPIIKELDFSVVVDLACGHGRNSELLRKLTRELHLVDINESCLDACRARFGASIDGCSVHYHQTNGNTIPVADNSTTLLYSWDSMVHFDKLVVRDYVREASRVLRSGGSAFLHHSNWGAFAPDTDWAKNTGTRSDMSAALMREFAAEFGLKVTSQHLQGTKEGWGRDDMDCASVLHKP